MRLISDRTTNCLDTRSTLIYRNKRQRQWQQQQHANIDANQTLPMCNQFSLEISYVYVCFFVPAVRFGWFRVNGFLSDSLTAWWLRCEWSLSSSGFQSNIGFAQNYAYIYIIKLISSFRLISTLKTCKFIPIWQRLILVFLVWWEKLLWEK